MDQKLSFILVAFCSIWFIDDASGASYNYTTGPFRIVYQSIKLPTLQIFRDGKLVWFSARDEGQLISAARIEEQVTQIGGDFVFAFDTQKLCTQAKITQTGTSGGGGYPVVYFIGDLCEQSRFQLLFQAVDVRAQGPGRRNAVIPHLNFTLQLLNATYNQVRLTYGCESDEQFYGFGAQYSKLNMKGQRLPVFLSEQGVGRGRQPLSLILDILSRGAGKLLVLNQNCKCEVKVH